jgi:cytochrome P450
MYHISRISISYFYQYLVTLISYIVSFFPKKPSKQIIQSSSNDLHTFNPLVKSNFINPYPYYQLLRHKAPVFKLPGQDYYLISRYDDIIKLAKNTEEVSNKIVEIIAMGRPKPPNKKGLTLIERFGQLGVIPVDVLATQDPPIHTSERKIGHSGFNAKFIKSLEPEVLQLCDEMLDNLIAQDEIEFVEQFAWALPMRLIIRLLGMDEKHYPQIKEWCSAGIKTLSGTATRAELVIAGAIVAKFMRFLWQEYLHIKANPDDYPDTCFTKTLARFSDDPESIMTDQRAVSTIFQLLIAGSDSSASTMGAAVKKIAEDIDIQVQLREDSSLIDPFIEEIFRTESAFQGHFRYLKEDMTIQGQHLKQNTRVFLMWGSGNRDERFWDNPDEFIIGRKNGKKHLTFGHGVHACIGRELARMEIRIVIKQLLARTETIEINGKTPYEASIFARTLIALPLRITGATSP